MGRFRLPFALAIVAAAITATLVAVTIGGTGSASGTVATWLLYERAGTSTPFAPGATGAGPTVVDGAGYEIVSFDGVPVSTGLATYVYGGADLPPARGGPAPAAVGCTADLPASGLLQLRVENVYPFSGCVFFVGASNTSDASIVAKIGPLVDGASIDCDAPGCSPDDIEVVTGGANPGDPGALCRSSDGSLESVGGFSFELQPGEAIVCPVFIVALQPAAEGALYTITVNGLPPIP